MTMKNVKKLLALGCAAMLALSMSGCSSGTEGASTEKADIEEAAGEEADAQEPGEGEPVTFVIANAELGTTLDPCNGFIRFTQKMVPLWAQTLVTYNFSTDEYELQLAESIEWADDYLSCIVKLKENVHFNNGTPLTAEDVAFTFERIKTDDSLTNTAKWGAIDNAEVIDTYTVQINFNKPMPTFNEINLKTPVICKSAYEADPEGFWNSPVGSGPYVVTEADFVDSHFRFERAEDWWGDSSTLGNIDVFEYYNVSEDTTRIAGVQTGEFDLAETFTPDQLTDYEGDSDLKVYEYEKLDHVMFELNTRENCIFNDIRMREALSLCIDRQLLVDSIIGGSVANWPTQKGNVGYVDYVGYEYNIEKAKELLSEAGYHGEEIEFIATESIIGHADEVMQAIQAMALEAGINLKISMVEMADYNERRFSGNYEVALGSFADLNIEVGELLYSKVDKFGTGYVNEELDALIEEGLVTVDDTARGEIYQKAFQIVMDEYAPFIYICNDPGAVLMGSDIEMTYSKLQLPSLLDIRKG